MLLKISTYHDMFLKYPHIINNKKIPTISTYTVKIFFSFILYFFIPINVTKIAIANK